jgi:hypothetical protein
MFSSVWLTWNHESLTRPSCLAEYAQAANFKSGLVLARTGTYEAKYVMELWPDKDPDFAWYGAKYYEKAIQLLMKELQPDARGLGTFDSA